MERRRQIRTNFGRVTGGFPESRSGLIIGDLQNEVFPQPLLCREMLCTRPPSPFSRENSSAWRSEWASLAIQGRIRALMKRENNGKSRPGPERFWGVLWGLVPDSRSGQKMGDSPPKSSSYPSKQFSLSTPADDCENSALSR